MIIFERAEYLPAVIAGYLFALFCVYLVCVSVRRKIRAYGKRPALKLLGKPTGLMRFILRFLALSLIPAGFALLILGPRWIKFHKEPIYEEMEIVILQDGSRSTLIKDIKPNKSRLDFMRDDLIEVVKHLKSNKIKDRIGFVLYADSAVPFVPIPTNDYERSLFPILEAIDCHFVAEVLPQGTDVGKAIETGVSLFTKESKTKLLILLGDGENQGEKGELESNLKKGVETYRKESERLRRGTGQGISLGGGYALKTLVIGVGDVGQVSKVPDDLNEDCSPRSFLKHTEGPQTGKEISSRPNYEFLGKIAGVLQGEFETAKESGEIAKKIKEVLSSARPVKGYELKEETKDISGWFFSAILILLIFYLFL